MAEDPPEGMPEFIPPPPRDRPLRADRSDVQPPSPPPPTASLPPPPIVSAPPPPPFLSLPAPTSPTVVKRNLLDWIGPRADRRPEPRVGIALAGAGAAMLVFGALVISIDQLVATDGDEGSQYPGLFITLGVVVVGVTLTARFRHGPLAAAGVAASAVALPPFVFFLTFSESSPPSFNTILFLTTAGWLAGYLLGPSRGHSLYLASALVGVWLWFLEVTEELFSFPVDFLSGLAVNASGDVIGGTPATSFDTNASPDATNIGVYTLGFAVAYLIIARVLDRRDKHGMATPFAFAGIVTLVIGIAALGDELETLGTGIAFAVAGLVLCYLGATEGRRATNWVGAVLVFVGLSNVLSEWFDTPSSLGLAEIVLGLGVIAVAQWVVAQFRERPETEAVLSRFYRVGSTQPSGPPPPPAGSVLG